MQPVVGGSQRRCSGAAEQEESESSAHKPAPSQGLWLPGGAQHPPVSSRFASEGGTEGRKVPWYPAAPDCPRFRWELMSDTTSGS